MKTQKNHLYLLLLLMMTFFSCGEEKDSEPKNLSIDPESITVSESGETTIISIVTNSDWQANSTSDWITFSPSFGSGNDQLDVEVMANPNPESREGNVRISISGIVRNLKIVQLAGVASKPDYYIPADENGMRPVSSLELSRLMGAGWNLGNSLEAIGGETAWGNPLVTPDLIQQVKNAGFNSVRIPVAWSKFITNETYEIDPLWLDRVEEVVNYALDQGMFVILNNHWDGGWMQPTYTAQSQVNERLEKIWIQVALRFRDYDDHLLFAGSNEVMVEGNYNAPSQENVLVQNGFNQVFVDAVRATGGKNAFRHLVVQSFNTNVDYGIQSLEIPEDEAEDRLMVEVHYYDPWEFALREDDLISQWGTAAKDEGKKATWGNEAHVSSQFKKLKDTFIDSGIPVIVGEFGAISKPSDPQNHLSRKHYLEFLTSEMKENGLIPFYWDNGFDGKYGFALFDRKNGNVLYPDLVEGLVK
ncbi:cellulase family glycosylhydrolase [Algoriphagus aestuarii]|nr:cellulase family glycosylhydrolase [Algoriphagus aestuarii]